MSRIKRGVTAWTHHKKVVSAAKGFRGRRSNVYHIAKQTIMRIGQYAYCGCRNRKRVFRVLWVVHIDVGACEHGLTYSKFINGLKKASIELDHEVLSDVAIHDKVAFAVTVNQVKVNVA